MPRTYSTTINSAKILGDLDVRLDLKAHTGTMSLSYTVGHYDAVTTTDANGVSTENVTFTQVDSCKLVGTVTMSLDMSLAPSTQIQTLYQTIYQQEQLDPTLGDRIL